MLRKRKGLSQDGLAALLNTTRNQLGKLERSQRRLNQDWIDKIAKALDVAPHEVIGPDDDSGRPWTPSDATLEFLLDAALPSVTGARASPDVIEVAAHAIGAALRTLSRRPENEGDPAAMQTLADLVVDTIEHQRSGTTQPA